MAHVESFYLDASMESEEVALPATENDQAELQFILDLPLNADSITRIVDSQLIFEKSRQVVSEYCVESEKTPVELGNPNAVSMNSSVLDNYAYFAPPNSDSSHYMFKPTDDVSSHHHYHAHSPNIYTKDYTSDYVYM